MTTMIQINEPETGNYYKEIEAGFCARRGKFKILSPLDWSLMGEWKTKNIPLHIVLSGINSAFGSKHIRDCCLINSLSYCKTAVETEFRNWQNGQVGASNKTENQSDELVDTLKILRARFVAALYNCRAKAGNSRDRLSSFLSAICSQLDSTIEAAIRFPQAINLEELRIKFDLQNERLAKLTRRAVSAEMLADWCAEILTDSRIAKFPESFKQQTLDALIDKRAIEFFELPTLSLFD